MAILSRIFRFLFWLLVLSWSMALLRRALRYLVRNAGVPAGTAGAGAGPSTVDATAASQQLVRDPVCGMHVAESLALALRDGATTVYFCSLECRAKYHSGERATRAASG